MLKNKKGFSLIELIVIIAILAVFAAILAPSLLQYTENSRAQKDVSAMDEVVNAVQLAMADQDCFDEMLLYSCTNNYLTYSDSSGNYGQQINDGEFWAPDGAGRATTITFNPNTADDGTTFWTMDTAILNDMTYGNGSVAQNRVMEGQQLSNIQCYLKNTTNQNGNNTGYLYGKIKSSIGNSVESDSETYQHSSFTVFIRFTQKDGVTVADVYGQFNGTNLYQDAPASVGTGTTKYEPDNTPVVSLNGGTQNSNYTSTDLSGGGSFGATIDYKNQVDVDVLEKSHKFGYYSSFELALQDVNNGTLGENSDCEKSNAKIGVFDDFNGKISIVVLDNIEVAERNYFTKNIDLNLNGKTITMTTLDSQIIAPTLSVNGTAPGSTIVTQKRARIFGCEAMLTVNGGIYNAYVPAGYSAYSGYALDTVFYSGNDGIYISNVQINVEVTAESDTNIYTVYGIGNTTQINNSEINVNTYSASKLAYGVYSTSNKNIFNNVKVKSNNKSNAFNNNVAGMSINGKEAIYNNCEIYGYRTGVYTHSTNSYIIGGTYTTNIYGGIYSSVGNVYAEGATFIKNEDAHYGSPIYIGGGETADNVHVYLNKCTIQTPSGSHAVALKTDMGNKNNNIYFSNMTFIGSKSLRMDTDEAYVHLGQNSNLTKNNAARPNNVIETNEEYKYHK